MAEYFMGCFDVSHWQGKINWAQIPNNYSLVFIKYTQGRAYVDPMHDEYTSGAEDRNLMVVPYHFITQDPATLQAAHFVQVAELKRGSPCMLDWEGQPDNIAPAEIVDDLISSLRVTTNRAPLIYRGIYTQITPRIANCPWHVPRYGKPPPNDKWLFWQDTPKFTIPGVPAPCDRDIFNGTEHELVQWFHHGTLPERLR